MGHIAPEHLAEIGRLVSDSPDKAISLTTLAWRLGITFNTARRRLEAYAAHHGLVLVSAPAREGKRGRQSATWYVQPSGQPLAPAATKAPRPAVVKRPPAPPAAPLEVPAGLPATLSAEERQAIAALVRVKTARTSELAKLLGLSPLRVDGMVGALRRKLRGRFRLADEPLPDGETLYRLQEEEAR